jgi:hypothetical protein
VLDAALENLLLEFDPTTARMWPIRKYLSSGPDDNILAMVQDAGFDKALQQLQAQLPRPIKPKNDDKPGGEEIYPLGHSTQKTIAHYRNIHHSWQFTPEQEQTLKHYYSANQLLVDCLNSQLRGHRRHSRGN